MSEFGMTREQIGYPEGFVKVEDIPTGDFRAKNGIDSNEFATTMVNYVQTNPNYEFWSTEGAIREVINVMANDIGAAQAFLDLIGVPVDLYNTEPEESNGS